MEVRWEVASRGGSKEIATCGIPKIPRSVVLLAWDMCYDSESHGTDLQLQCRRQLLLCDAASGCVGLRYANPTYVLRCAMLQVSSVRVGRNKRSALRRSGTDNTELVILYVRLAPQIRRLG